MAAKRRYKFNVLAISTSSSNVLSFVTCDGARRSSHAARLYWQALEWAYRRQHGLPVSPPALPTEEG